MFTFLMFFKTAKLFNCKVIFFLVIKCYQLSSVAKAFNRRTLFCSLCILLSVCLQCIMIKTASFLHLMSVNRLFDSLESSPLLCFGLSAFAERLRDGIAY